MKVYHLTLRNSTMCTEIKGNACQKWAPRLTSNQLEKQSFLKEKDVQNNNVIFLPSFSGRKLTKVSCDKAVIIVPFQANITALSNGQGLHTLILYKAEVYLYLFTESFILLVIYIQGYLQRFHLPFFPLVPFTPFSNPWPLICNNYHYICTQINFINTTCWLHLVLYIGVWG